MSQVPFRVFFEPEPGHLIQGEPGPAGPAGAGLVKQIISAQGAPGATTTNTSWMHTGHSIQVTPMLGNKVRLSAQGRFGHTDSGAIVHFTWFRAGTPDVDLTPVGWSGLDSPRIVNTDYTEGFDLTPITDSPNTDVQVEYKLMWKVHGGTAHLGKRPSDAVMNVGAFLEAIEVIA